MAKGFADILAGCFADIFAAIFAAVLPGFAPGAIEGNDVLPFTGLILAMASPGMARVTLFGGTITPFGGVAVLFAATARTEELRDGGATWYPAVPRAGRALGGEATYGFMELATPGSAVIVGDD